MSSLKEFLWENYNDNSLSPTLKKKYFKLKQWPNFGFSNYSDEFLDLSALLMNRELNYKQICKTLKISKKKVNHFLNVCSLLQILECSDHPYKIENESGVSFTLNSFTQKMKRFFIRDNVVHS